jgi:hypothetical protein
VAESGEAEGGQPASHGHAGRDLACVRWKRRTGRAITRTCLLGVLRLEEG